MAPPRVPPLFAHALRYAAGDNVRSPFGSGVVVRSSDSRAHVEVQLAFGATLFATVRPSGLLYTSILFFLLVGLMLRDCAPAREPHA